MRVLPHVHDDLEQFWLWGHMSVHRGQRKEVADVRLKHAVFDPHSMELVASDARAVDCLPQRIGVLGTFRIISK